MWARLINVLLGVWLMAAPAVLRYGGAARINDRIIGPVVASCAIIAVSEVTRPVRWANLVLGIWLLAAPWVLVSPRVVVLHSTAVGILMILCARVRGRLSQRFGGGWSALKNRG